MKLQITDTTRDGVTAEYMYVTLRVSLQWSIEKKPWKSMCTKFAHEMTNGCMRGVMSELLK